MNKKFILIVEDIVDILDNIVLILEFNQFETITAKNGKEALEKMNLLSNKNIKPDLIISDIMMPEMNGYEFLKEISVKEKWSSIPFIFLSVLASPEEIRLGKLLGVSDYLTKPFKEDDLLASVIGKLLKVQKVEEIAKKVNESVRKLISPKKYSQKSNEIFLLYSLWDEEKGPILKDFYTETENLVFDPQQLAIQLFQSTTSIYGFSEYGSAEGFLLEIKNIDKKGYIFFDTILDNTVRGNKRIFMLSVIASRISYLESLKIRKILKEQALKLKNSEKLILNDIFISVRHSFLSPY